MAIGTPPIRHVRPAHPHTFLGCHFSSWAHRKKDAPAILIRHGGLTVDGCEFMAPGKRQLTLAQGAAAAIVVGNRFHGPARIRNQIGGRAAIATNAAG